MFALKDNTIASVCVHLNRNLHTVYVHLSTSMFVLHIWNLRNLKTKLKYNFEFSFFEF